MTWQTLDGETDIVFSLDYISVRDTYQPAEPSTAADQSRNLIIQSLPSPSLSFPLSLSFFFPLFSSLLLSFPSSRLKAILKAFLTLSKARGDKIKCLKERFQRQLWFHFVLQPDLYMTARLRPSAVSAEEVRWLLCLVEGDLECCRVNGFPFRCGVCPNCCLRLLDCSGISPRLG